MAPALVATSAFVFFVGVATGGSCPMILSTSLHAVA
jgi:hypothetical protein